MAKKFYGINDKWTDDSVNNDIMITSEDGTISEVTVNGTPYGGGGDLSIANVVITNNTADEVQIGFAEIITGGFLGTRITGPIFIAASETSNHKIPLYQGVTHTIFMGTVAVSGSISVAEGAITVSGDGTITIS